MSGSDSHRIPPNRVGLSLLLLLAAWLVFSFYPREQKPPPVAPPPVAESKLGAVGLRENLDWEGLPEFFAIWADHAEWKDNRTQFAYWHPVMKDFSYHFEVVRVDGGYRFKEISEPIFPNDYWPWDDSLGEECPIRFYRAPPMWPQDGVINARLIIKTEKGDSTKVKVDLAVPKIAVPDAKSISALPPPKF